MGVEKATKEADSKKKEAESESFRLKDSAKCPAACPAQVSEKETKSIDNRALDKEDDRDLSKKVTKEMDERKVAAKKDVAKKEAMVEKVKEEKEDMPEKMMKKEKSTTEKVLQSKLA